jgi:hypothetical protein
MKVGDRLRETENFTAHCAYSRGRAKVLLQCKSRRVTPQKRIITWDEWCRYLSNLTTEFDNACVIDYGLGVFEK